MKPVFASKPITRTVSRGHTLRVSNRAYRFLLAAYPAEFRRRYGPEMAQVFRTCCRATYRASGPRGVARLWLPTLWDWSWTAALEWFSTLFRRSAMNDTVSFDRQAGDLVWSLVTGLRAAYSLPQVIEAISIEAPEPTASAFKRLHAELTSGLPLEQGLANLVKAVPSRHLAQVVAVIQEQRKTGGNLGDLLAPLVDSILAQTPSDGAFFPAMRREAETSALRCPTGRMRPSNSEARPLFPTLSGIQERTPPSPVPFPYLGEGENGGNLDVLGCSAPQHIQISAFHPPSHPDLGGEKGGRGDERGNLPAMPAHASPIPALLISDRVYRILLAGYPAEFRQRYGPEMAQVFRTCCRASYDSSGARGVARLWLPTLWDWVWTAASERFSSLFRRSTVYHIHTGRTSSQLIPILFCLNACLIFLFICPCSWLFGDPLFAEYCYLHVDNQSGKTLRVTPLYTDGNSISAVRLYRTSFPYSPAYQQGNISVKSGNKVALAYDCDSTGVSALYACDLAGECYVQWRSHYVYPMGVGVTFNSLENLSRPETALEAAVQAFPEHNYRGLRNVLLCIVQIIFLVGGVYWLVRTKTIEIPKQDI